MAKELEIGGGQLLCIVAGSVVAHLALRSPRAEIGEQDGVQRFVVVLRKPEIRMIAADERAQVAVFAGHLVWQTRVHVEQLKSFLVGRSVPNLGQFRPELLVESLSIPDRDVVTSQLVVLGGSSDFWHFL